MSDDRLRIVAEVQDGFTGPLGKLETALKRAGSTGTQAAKDLKKDFDGFHGTLGKATSALQGITPVLSALGVGGLAAGVSLGAITAALGGFSKGTQQLAIMSKETGLAVDQLRAFGALGERFGASAETMQGGVRRFSDEMSQLRKRYGEAYSGLQAMNLGELVEKLVNAPNMKAALDRAMDSLSNIGDPVRRRKVAEMLFGTDQIGAVAGQVTGRYRSMMEEIQSNLGHTTEAQVAAAKKFEASLSSLRENLDGLRHEALGPLLVQLDEIIKRFSSPESMTAFKGQLEEIGKFARTTVQEFEAIVRTYEKFKEFIGLGDPSKNKEFTPVLGGPPGARQLEGRRDSIEQQRRLLDADPSAPDYQRKRDRMTDELKRVGDELEKLRATGGATAQPSAYGGAASGGGSLIHKASFGGGGGGFGGGSPGLGGFGGPLPTMGGGYGGGNPNMTGGGSARGYGGQSGGSSAPLSSGAAEGSPVLTPRGSGRGNPGAARTSEMMAYAMDQLRREGVPEAQLRQSAAHLVGQAHMESGLDPNKVHDNGTGYGIYGARDPKGWGNYPGARRSAMVRWLEANGYARNSAEGQMRYMTHEAMSGQYRKTRRILMGQGSGNLVGDTNAITKEFESPAVINHRAGAVAGALRTGPDDAVTGGRPLPGLSRLRDEDIEDPRSHSRPGDKLMGRMYGGEDAASSKTSKGSLDITLHGFPAGTKPRASMDDLFKDVNVSKSRQMDTTSL